MNDELIKKVVEFCLTNIETYSDKQTPEAIKMADGDHYWMTIKPDRIEPGEMLKGSADHRQKRIAAWQVFALRVFGDCP